MNPTHNLTNPIDTQSLDAAWLARIVRQVVARVESQSGGKLKSVETMETTQVAEIYTGKLVSLETINQWVASRKTQIKIEKKTLVTPAAVDEAKRHGITILRVDCANSAVASSAVVSSAAVSSAAGSRSASKPASAGYELSDRQDPQRAVLISEQLRRRNVTGSAVIVISDTPAAEVFRLCSEQRRAVMIADLASVERFANELSPDVWVLDMQKLNLIAAVNVAQQILQRKVA